jgi:murein DD-endopeptidase MepM/ murein hydrolase activator NlpD
MNKARIKALNLIIIIVTVITCVVCYNSYKSNAYEVYLNGKSIAYVADKTIVENINNEVIKEIKDNAENFKINSDLSYKKIIVDEKALSDRKTIKENILKILNPKVKAAEMIVDDKSIGVLRSREDIEKVLNQVSQHYLSTCGLENKKVKGIKNKVSYQVKKLHISEVSTSEDIAKHIISLNENSSKPVLSVEITGQKVENSPVNYSTSITWTESLKQGESKVKAKGVKGLKQLTKEVTLLNGKATGAKVLKEIVLQKPVDEVVLKGSKSIEASTNQVLAMYVPSRGTVSSNFGMRWGRMHKGIDIAAPTGTPISAALDGEVIFAGWSNGYGNLIKIAHGGNIETAYGHCSSIDVKVNDKVKKGDVIGKVGSTGNSTGPHVHFEVKVNGEVQNPAPYIYKK